MTKYFFGSVARITHLENRSFSVEKRPRNSWGTGDYVVGEVVRVPGSLCKIELTTGREVQVSGGDCVIGALGRRCATLESVGGQAIGKDLRLEALTAAGVIGRCTSKCSFLPPLLNLDYRGHVIGAAGVVNMRACVERKPRPAKPPPVILIIGTSMDSGKTLSAKVIVRLLKARGLRVAGVKFTGVGRYKDILAMSDSGADSIFDFVDAGLPSTACDRTEFKGVVEHILALTTDAGADVIVGEAGASPLEPYNGDTAVAQLKHTIACTILCASDPYAVLGVMHAFDAKPELIAGRATCTSAGVELVEKLCGVKALDLMDPQAIPELDGILEEGLRRSDSAPP